MAGTGEESGANGTGGLTWMTTYCRTATKGVGAAEKVSFVEIGLENGAYKGYKLGSHE